MKTDPKAPSPQCENTTQALKLATQQSMPLSPHKQAGQLNVVHEPLSSIQAVPM